MTMSKTRRRATTQDLLADLEARGFDRCEPIGRDDYGQFKRGVRVRCSQCEALVINGIACHETGCPHDRRYQCGECGSEYHDRQDAADCCTQYDTTEAEYDESTGELYGR
jgi:hypothetical protein